MLSLNRKKLGIENILLQLDNQQRYSLAETRMNLIKQKIKEYETMNWYGGPGTITPPAGQELTTEGGVTLTTEDGQAILVEP